MTPPSQIDADPFLIVGWRKGGSIECRKMAINRGLFDDIRMIVEKHLEFLGSADERPYEPAASLEQGEEYFHVPIESIPTHETDDGPEQASLLSQLQAIGRLPVATPDDLDKKTLLFYAFSFQQGPTEQWLTFLRKVNPTSFFRARRWWCTTEIGLTRLETRPTFAFDDTFDLLLAGDRILASSQVALKHLFTEVNLSAIDVDKYVDSFVSSLPVKVTINDSSKMSLINLARRKTSFVSRVYGLAHRLEEISAVSEFTAETFVAAIDDDEVSSELVSGNEIVLDTEKHAQAFIDAVEGRYFRDGWTQVRRRADRFSSR